MIANIPVYELRSYYYFSILNKKKSFFASLFSKSTTFYRTIAFLVKLKECVKYIPKTYLQDLTFKPWYTRISTDTMKYKSDVYHFEQVCIFPQHQSRTKNCAEQVSIFQRYYVAFGNSQCAERNKCATYNMNLPNARSCISNLIIDSSWK